MSDESFVTHGARPSKGNGKKRKGVDEYAAENWEDFVPKSMIREGQPTRVLVCRFCCLSVGARSDRIKEHMASKRHNKMKLEHFRAVEEDDVGLGASDPGVSEKDVPLLPPPPTPQGEEPEKISSETGSGDGEIEEYVGNVGEDFWSNSSTTESVDSTSPPPPLVPVVPQQIMNVKWNDYNSNLFSMFASMRKKEQFVDVTLICEGKSIKCHRIVLAACSPYFENFFKVTPNPAVVVISDIKFWELESMVDFMYSGEVSAGKDQLQSLCRAANIYQVSGLGSSTGSLLGMMGMETGSEYVQENELVEIIGALTPTSKTHAYHSHRLGGNAASKANTNQYQNPREFGTRENPMMGIDMTTHKTALGPLEPKRSGWNGGYGSSYFPLSLSGNGGLEGGGGGFSQVAPANRKRKKATATRRVGNRATPRGMPLLLPILPFCSAHRNSIGILDRNDDRVVSKSEVQRSQRSACGR